MSSLLKCHNCKTYTLQETCSKCDQKTTSAHKKFPKIRDAPKGEFKRR